MRLLTCALLCAATISANAQHYRWQDESGRIHYTDTLPPSSARNVQERDAAPAVSEPVEPLVLQQARKSSPVTLYSAPGCDSCDEARKLLNARGIPFKEVSVVNQAQFDELKNAVGGNSIPALIVGSEVQKGFGESAYNSLLDAAGYPRAGVLPARSQSAPAPVEPRDAGRLPEPPRAPGPYAPRRGPSIPLQRN